MKTKYKRPYITINVDRLRSPVELLYEDILEMKEPKD